LLKTSKIQCLNQILKFTYKPDNTHIGYTIHWIRSTQNNFVQENSGHRSYFISPEMKSGLGLYTPLFYWDEQILIAWIGFHALSSRCPGIFFPAIHALPRFYVTVHRFILHTEAIYRSWST